MLSILFVDDDPHVLDGLKRNLRSLRHIWTTDFVDSGQAALDLLADREFDVVVSDLRMPGMDGAKLLQQVANLYPGTVRLILSGHADEEGILCTIGPAHQFLSKPCDSDKLQDTIQRACALQQVLRSDQLKKIVANIATLPSVPTLFQELVHELHSPDASMQRVGEIISKDVAMTAKVLQLVNSSFFGLGWHITSTSQAASVLGLSTLKSLVLATSTFSQLDTNRTTGLSVDKLVNHSMTVGNLAASIAAKETKQSELVNDSRAAGMMHDIGKLVLAANFPEYSQILREAAASNTEIWRLEEQVFGVSHAEIGGYLLGLWGLPNTVVEAVAFHHVPFKSPTTTFSPLTAVHVANALVYKNGDSQPHPIDTEFLEAAGVAQKLNDWNELLERSREVAAT